MTRPRKSALRRADVERVARALHEAAEPHMMCMQWEYHMPSVRAGYRAMARAVLRTIQGPISRRKFADDLEAANAR